MSRNFLAPSPTNTSTWATEPSVGPVKVQESATWLAGLSLVPPNVSASDCVTSLHASGVSPLGLAAALSAAVVAVLVESGASGVPSIPEPTFGPAEPTAGPDVVGVAPGLSPEPPQAERTVSAPKARPTVSTRTWDGRGINRDLCSRTAGRGYLRAVAGGATIAPCTNPRCGGSI